MMKAFLLLASFILMASRGLANSYWQDCYATTGMEQCNDWYFVTNGSETRLIPIRKWSDISVADKITSHPSIYMEANFSHLGFWIQDGGVDLADDVPLFDKIRRTGYEVDTDDPFWNQSIRFRIGGEVTEEFEIQGDADTEGRPYYLDVSLNNGFVTRIHAAWDRHLTSSIVAADRDRWYRGIQLSMMLAPEAQRLVRRLQQDHAAAPFFTVDIGSFFGWDLIHRFDDETSVVTVGEPSCLDFTGFAALAFPCDALMSQLERRDS